MCWHFVSQEVTFAYKPLLIVLFFLKKSNELINKIKLESHPLSSHTAYGFKFHSYPEKKGP